MANDRIGGQQRRAEGTGAGERAHVVGLARVAGTRQPFEQVVRDMDVVFDTMGGDTFPRAFKVLRGGGFLVTSVAFPKDEARDYGVGVARVLCKPDAGQLASIRELAEAGQLKAHFATVLPLAEIKEAFELSESGRTRGKIVLQIAA